MNMDGRLELFTVALEGFGLVHIWQTCEPLPTIKCLCEAEPLPNIKCLCESGRRVQYLEARTEFLHGKRLRGRKAKLVVSNSRRQSAKLLKRRGANRKSPNFPLTESSVKHTQRANVCLR
jgi:hypothetical protein